MNCFFWLGLPLTNETKSEEPQEKSAFLNVAAQAYFRHEIFRFWVFEAHFHVKNFGATALS